MLLQTLIISCIVIAVAFLLLGIRIFFIKGGKFPNTHVSGNKALREKGITCAKSQDREARRVK